MSLVENRWLVWQEVICTNIFVARMMYDVAFNVVVFVYCRWGTDTGFCWPRCSCATFFCANLLLQVLFMYLSIFQAVSIMFFYINYQLQRQYIKFIDDDVLSQELNAIFYSSSQKIHKQSTFFQQLTSYYFFKFVFKLLFVVIKLLI